MFGIATGKGKKNIFQYISVFNWRHFAPPPDKGKCWFISIPVSPPPCVLFTSFSPLYQEHPRKYNSCHAHYCRGCCGVSPKVLDDSQAWLYLNVFFELLNLLSWGSYNGFFCVFFSVCFTKLLPACYLQYHALQYFSKYIKVTGNTLNDSHYLNMNASCPLTHVCFQSRNI